MDTFLVAVDFSESSYEVTDYALRLAHSSAGGICLVHVVPAHVPVPFNIDRDQLRHARACELRDEHGQLQRWAERCRESGVQASARLLKGLVEEVLIGEACRIKATAIIVGAQGHGNLFHALLGGVTCRLLDHSPVPVIVVPESAHRPLGRGFQCSATGPQGDSRRLS